MKLLLATLLLTTPAAHAQSWPRNPKTGKAKFVGTLPWPSGTATDSARQALAWRWYVGRVTTEGLQKVEQRNAAAISKNLLTYAGLPKVAGATVGRYYANYQVDLMPSPAGLFIYLHDITLANLAAGAPAVKVETELANPKKGEPAALAELRRRLAVAVHNW